MTNVEQAMAALVALLTDPDSGVRLRAAELLLQATGRIQ